MGNTPLNINSPFSKLKEAKKKQILQQLSSCHNISTKELEEFYFYTSKSNKIYISKIKAENYSQLKVNSIGLYFGTLQDEKRFRLSVEGSQLIKPKENFCKLKDSKAYKKFLSAQDLTKEDFEEISWNNQCPYLIVQFKEENLGCTNFKEDIAFNYVPKSRKIEEDKLF